VSGLVRKNLMVDAEEVAALALARGTSESDAVRHAVAEALAAEEIVGALAELHQARAFADTPRARRLYGPPVTIDYRTRRVRPTLPR
jgi:hypothetical protein